MVIKPRVRGFICTTAHPVGCAANVDEQIAFIKEQAEIHGPKRVLVIGSSTGYGLASRIVAAFGAQADTIGVFFERPSASGRPASAGWYNAAAFEKRAKEAGYYARSFNGDAFSDELKEQVIETIRKDWGQVDLIIYSLAAPKRKDPETGEVYSSVLKPIGKTFSSKSVDFQTGKVTETTIEPATEDEIRQTVAVMGGDDWSRWIRALAEAKVLSKGAQTVAYSYIGPELTHDIYRTGTIGRAKDDLEQTTHRLSEFLQEEVGGQAYVSVNKALVTQSSAAIPVVPLYISLLYKVMKEKGLHEDCIQQMYRLFADRLYGEVTSLDEEGRIRIDDWEMREDVQQEVKKRWAELNTENIEELSDIAGYRQEFLKLFGFEVPGVDYQADVDVEVPIASVEQK
jgi:enoyl-[acyl-carrier protein] reductase/trans-2-enoyl-CoA reductase (NAD+)